MDATRETVLAEVSEKFEVFHIMINASEKDNNDILVGRKMNIKYTEIAVIPEIIISTIQLTNGMDKEKIISQWDAIDQPIVRNAINQLNIVSENDEVNL